VSRGATPPEPRQPELMMEMASRRTRGQRDIGTQGWENGLTKGRGLIARRYDLSMAVAARYRTAWLPSSNHSIYPRTAPNPAGGGTRDLPGSCMPR
jgi:hypothetical protein